MACSGPFLFRLDVRDHIELLTRLFPWEVLVVKLNTKWRELDQLKKVKVDKLTMTMEVGTLCGKAKLIRACYLD